MEGTCPICEAEVSLKEDILVSEILSCPDCHSVLVVEAIDDHRASLREAPAIEEDWGQ
ncbi:MAG: lysine biosynthesis protein LysW [Candidatus Saccharicenans sp.]|nr:lysine biosynthesis protein LysW [Candidatus Saccharicenans sp.]